MKYKKGDRVLLKRREDDIWVFSGLFRENQEAIIQSVSDNGEMILSVMNERDNRVYTQSCDWRSVESIRPVVLLDDSLFEIE